ncbi:hypothetical protein CC1G_05893 [Coprinopsis cinerea okayama7|uniref:Uncharacterized protein n=1 Tax=Coprinopsis cinerea (strain Okayama-7 / 130 / ATCC MYA-4618 / FGSC 9003) TaxID=240176 RepID=A8NAE2_COPC7|nr:hypothetical protein CC1G_05893 [Coprinopsis cinerea okayama7\|eukprot:XP_001831794.2 hypothetical protein CC1G_05893 [Coprinopsis cinerea okayama7\
MQQFRALSGHRFGHVYPGKYQQPTIYRKDYYLSHYYDRPSHDLDPEKYLQLETEYRERSPILNVIISHPGFVPPTGYAAAHSENSFHHAPTEDEDWSNMSSKEAHDAPKRTLGVESKFVPAILLLAYSFTEDRSMNDIGTEGRHIPPTSSTDLLDNLPKVNNPVGHGYRGLHETPPLRLA